MAEEIIEGRVTDIREAVNVRGMPVTLITVSVAESLKGEAGASYTVELLGGQLGDMELTVPGMPVFAAGDQVVLFLAENGAAVCPLVGGGQGYFRVRPASTGTDLVVEQYPSDGVLGRPARRTVTATPWLDGTTTLKEFKGMIRAELERPDAAAASK